MVAESKPLPEAMLKETYVLLNEARLLWDALRLYDNYAGVIPDGLMEMFEERLKGATQNLSDLINPFPF